MIAINSLPHATKRQSSHDVSVGRGFSQEAALISFVLPELEASAAYVSIAASLANAMGENEGSSRAYLEALLVHIPPDLVQFSHVALDLLTFEAGAHLLARTQVFNARLTFAKRLTSQACAERTPARQSPRMTTAKITNVWQVTAEALLAALHAAQEGLTKYGCPQDPTSYRLNTLLRDVRNGSSPCLDEDGRLHFPGWADRRKSLRQPARRPCRVRFHETQLDVILIDLSPGGAGFSGTPRDLYGAEVTIELEGGREIDGNVAWISSERWGMRFKTRLSANDPLFAEDLV